MSRYPSTPNDYSHLVMACNELIAAADLHEDADPDDRAAMRKAMKHLIKVLDKKCDFYCRRELAKLINPNHEFAPI